MADDKPNYQYVGIFAAILFVIFIIIIVFSGLNISELDAVTQQYGDDMELESAKTAQILLMGVSVTILIVFFAAILFFFTEKSQKILAIGTLILFCVVLFFVFLITAITLGFVTNSPDYHGGTNQFDYIIVYSSIKMALSILLLIAGILLIIYLAFFKKEEKKKSFLSIGKE